MKQRLVMHLVPHEGAWLLKDSCGHESPIKTKREGVSAGVARGRKHGYAQLVIHTRDGKIQSERTYGADPERSLG
jgi:hypothetical protein